MKYFIDQLKLKQVLEWYNALADSMDYESEAHEAFRSLKELILNCTNDELIVFEKTIKKPDGGFIIYIPYINWDYINDKLKPYVRRKIWDENRDFAFDPEVTFLGFSVNCFLYDISENSEFKKEDLNLNNLLKGDKYIALDIILEKLTL